MAKFLLGESVQVKYIDALNKPLVIKGVIHSGPLGESEPYWYVKTGGIAVLIPEEAISHVEESSQGQNGQSDGGVQTGNAA